MPKVRVPVSGTIGKSVLIDSGGTAGAQVGTNLTLADGSTPTLAELARALYAASPPAVNVTTEASSGGGGGGVVFEDDIVDGSILARVAAAETISGNWTVTASWTFNDNVELRFGTGNDVRLDWDGTDFEVRFAATNRVWNFNDGVLVRFWDETEARNVSIETVAGAGRISTSGSSVPLQLLHGGVEALRTEAVGNVLSRASIKDGNGDLRYIGFNEMPVFEQDVDDNFDKEHAGHLWHKDSGVAVTYTCMNDSTIRNGATWTVANEDTENLTIAEGVGVTLRWFDGNNAPPQTGDRMIAQGSVATVYKYTDTEYWMWGNDVR